MYIKKKKLIPRALALAFALALAVCLLAGCGGNNKPAETTIPDVSDIVTVDPDALNAFIALVDYGKLNQVEAIFEEYYIGEYKPYSEVGTEVLQLLIEHVELSEVTDVDEATTLFIGAYLDALGDKYAYYYDSEAFDDYTSDSRGEYVGIGISVIITEDNYIEAITVFKDGPADKAGILPGDILTKVDGEDIAELGYYESIDKVKGEINTRVNITLLRDGEEMTFDVIRDKVTEITVDYEMKEGNVGYIHITSFDDKTYDQFVAAYEELVSAGAEGIIFDVRNNPGGRLDAVVAVVEYILPDGPIVHMQYKNKANNYSISSVLQYNPYYIFTHKYEKNHQIDLPMVIITNGNTASAGELFTSSLKDYKVATIVGATTYGKGVGQTSFNLKDINGKEDGSAVTITYFYYAPPYSENYDGVGIAPDLEIELSEEAQKKNLYKLTSEEDVQLAAALSEIKAKIATHKTMVNK